MRGRDADRADGAAARRRPVARVAGAGPARAAVWSALLVAALLGARAPAAPGALAPQRLDGRCALARAGAGPACACGEADARLRLVSGRPLDLNRASPRELAWLPGIGPARAAAIAQERAADGPFHSLTDLARRVRGIGPVAIARLDGKAEARETPGGCR